MPLENEDGVGEAVDNVEEEEEELVATIREDIIIVTASPRHTSPAVKTAPGLLSHHRFQDKNLIAPRFRTSIASSVLK